MPKNILIFNSNKKTVLPGVLLDELAHRGFFFALFSANADDILKFREKNWPGKKFNFALAPAENSGSFKTFVFSILLPVLFLANLARLSYLKAKMNAGTILCLSMPEKIVFSGAARLLKIKVIWLEYPENSYEKYGRVISFFFRRSARHAAIICYNSFSAHRLAKIGVKKDAIKIIRPGIKVGQYARQDNIFSNLARAEHRKIGKKFFTVGAAGLLDDEKKIETLLHAVKRSMEIISNIQLIIVGEGPLGPTASPWPKWLTKKMEMDGIVWFVGAQKNAKKWLESFDVFVAWGEGAGFADLEILLNAMLLGLPVIGARNAGLEEILIDNQTGLAAEEGSSENISAGIIRLHQNFILRKRLGEAAKKAAAENFSSSRMADDFIRACLL